MSEPSAPVERPRPRRAIVIAGVVAAALVIAAAGATVVAQLSASDPGSSPQASSPSTPHTPAPSAQSDIPLSAGDAEGAGMLSDEHAEAVVTTVLNARSTGTDGVASLERQLAKLVKGSYLTELQAQQQELDAYGWKITGDVTVASVKVGKVDTRGSHPKATVTACIDHTDTATIDAEGTALPKAPGSMRALHRFTFAQSDDGTWAVIRHTFPNNPAC